MDLNYELFGNITTGMLSMFFLGVFSLFSYAWTMHDQEVKHGDHTHKKFLRLTAANITFHLIASFMVLMLMHEISETVITRWVPALEKNGTYHYTLSALTGLGGSMVVAWMLVKIKNKFGSQKHE